MKPIEFGARRTGQTTWYIFKAAQKVIEGKQVIVVAENHEQAKEICQQIYRVLTVCIPESCLSRTHTTIRNSPSKTSVICVSNDYATRNTDFMKGVYNIALLVDVKGCESDFTRELIRQMNRRDEEVI